MRISSQPGRRTAASKHPGDGLATTHGPGQAAEVSIDPIEQAGSANCVTTVRYSPTGYASTGVDSGNPSTTANRLEQLTVSCCNHVNRHSDFGNCNQWLEKISETGLSK